jgi:hypothetical protein
VKPIKIVKVSGGYHVFVRDAPLVQGNNGKGVTHDLAKAGVASNVNPPLSTEPLLIKKAGDAAGLAHQVGRYVLNLGDFTFSYTELVGINGNHEAWWDRALH